MPRGGLQPWTVPLSATCPSSWGYHSCAWASNSMGRRAEAALFPSVSLSPAPHGAVPAICQAATAQQRCPLLGGSGW